MTKATASAAKMVSVNGTLMENSSTARETNSSAAAYKIGYVVGDNALHLLDVVAHGFLHRAGLPAGEKAQIQFSHMVQDAHTQVVERPKAQAWQITLPATDSKMPAAMLASVMPTQNHTCEGSTTARLSEASRKIRTIR